MDNQTHVPLMQSQANSAGMFPYDANSMGVGGNNPIAALSIARNIGTYGNTHNPRATSITPPVTPKGSTFGRGNMGTGYPLTPPITSKEGEEAHDATNLVFEVGAWNPNADEQHFSTHLEPGDPVYVAPPKKHGINIVEMFNVGQLNKRLRDAYLMVMSSFNHESRVGAIGETTKFMKLLEEFGESGLELFHIHYMQGTLELLFDSDNRDTRSRLAQLHKLATSDQYYCMTSFGIDLRWKFVGFVLTTSDPLRIKGSQKLGYSRKLSVNVTVRGEIQRALNLWGGYKEVDSGSKLHFILRKHQGGDGEECFEVVPWGSRDRLSIPNSVITYKDYNGLTVRGKSSYVGYIQLPTQKKFISKPTVLMACGLIPDTFDKIREAAAGLSFFRLEVKMI